MMTDLNPSNVAASLRPRPHFSPTTLDTPPGMERLLVWLSPRSSEAFALTLSHLNQTFQGQDPGQGVFVATSGFDAAAISADSFPNLRTLAVPAATLSIANRFITATDYVNAFQFMQDYGAQACLLLGAESDALNPASLLQLASAVLVDNTDLAVPYYEVSSHQGLVNSAILYPLSRTLFGAFPRFPLPIDLGLSYRMVERLALQARPALASLGSEDAIVWPVIEAAVNNFTIVEVPTGPYSLPQPPPTDLNALLAVVLGSLFSDIDAKAAYWQRVRPSQPAKAIPAAIASTVPWPDVQPMLDAFRLAYTNLSAIWSLVLPPNSLVGLKHLSLMPAESFHMSDALWVRIVYDFILAYRQRTLNRGHLLGALTPLYLAWVASHIRLSDNGELPEKHIQDLAAAFENDKAYLVSRWRWPDRFNP